MTYRQLRMSLGLAPIFVIATLLPSARADEWDKRTIVTVDSNVKIPGKVLAPGTYVFKLLNSATDRNIVLVYNEAENELIATVSAIPAYRLNISDQTVLTFETSESGSVPRLKKWFYPAENDGLEFVYSEEAGAPVSELRVTAT
jgi:hypothetical protein